MRFYLAACPTSFKKCPLAAAAAAKDSFHCSPQQFSLLKKIKQCWPLLFRHLLINSHRQTSHFLCNWDALLVDSVYTGAKGVMMHTQETCRRQIKGSEEEKTLWQGGENSFAEGIQPISGGRRWLMRSLICKNNSFCISSFSSSQAFATKATHVWNFNLKWCFYLNPPHINLWWL